MAPPVEAPLNPEAIARAVTGLPAALFIGDVSGPLNAETSALGEKLDPKLEEIKVSFADRQTAGSSQHCRVFPQRDAIS